MKCGKKGHVFMIFLYHQKNEKPLSDLLSGLFLCKGSEVECLD